MERKTLCNKRALHQESYLRSICDLHSGQKAVRLERELQFQRMSRLEIKAQMFKMTKNMIVILDLCSTKDIKDNL